MKGDVEGERKREAGSAKKELGDVWQVELLGRRMWLSPWATKLLNRRRS